MNNILNWIIILILYLYTSYCFMKIGDKLKVKNSWLTFIPIANFWYFVKLNKQDSSWVLAYIIPILLMTGIAYFVVSTASSPEFATAYIQSQYGNNANLSYYTSIIMYASIGFFIVAMLLVTYWMWFILRLLRFTEHPEWYILLVLLSPLNLVILGLMAFTKGRVKPVKE